MIASVLRTIRRYDMLPPGGRVLCALSGGADSVALLHVLRDLETRGELAVAGVAHFNHGLRGAEADEDERFCRDLAASLGLPFDAGRADVRSHARAAKRSIEDAARTLRYEFLRQAAERCGADAVAVGHTLDDQAETFLLRLLRGAGTRGLGSIRPKAGIVIRPLIEVRREALRALVRSRGLAHREDSSNADRSIPRNRIRHELLPQLEREYSRGIVEVLAREAASAQEDEDLLSREAIDLSRSIVLTGTDPARVILDAAALNVLHPAMAARVARLALQQAAGGRFVGFDHVRRLLELSAHGGVGAALSLPGQQVRVRVTRDGSDGAERRLIEMGPEPPRKPRPARQPAGRPGTGSASVTG